jgi:hypothetical protein
MYWYMDKWYACNDTIIDNFPVISDEVEDRMFILNEKEWEEFQHIYFVLNVLDRHNSFYTNSIHIFHLSHAAQKPHFFHDAQTF